MKATFAAYSALDELLPRETRTIVSNFHCEVEPYVRGLWVQSLGTQVIPMYLTKTQLEELELVPDVILGDNSNG